MHTATPLLLTALALARAGTPVPDAEVVEVVLIPSDEAPPPVQLAKDVETDLKRHPGIARVRTLGVVYLRDEVVLDPDRLAATGTEASMVVHALREAAPFAEEGELLDLALPSAGPAPVSVRDVAKAVLAVNEGVAIQHDVAWVMVLRIHLAPRGDPGIIEDAVLDALPAGKAGVRVLEPPDLEVAMYAPPRVAWDVATQVIDSLPEPEIPFGIFGLRPMLTVVPAGGPGELVPACITVLDDAPDDLESTLRETLAATPGVAWRVGSPHAAELRLTVGEPGVADAVLGELERAALATPGVLGVWDPGGPAIPTVRVHLDPTKLAALGLSAAGVEQTVQLAQGGVEVGLVADRPVVVRFDLEDPEELGKLLLATPTGARVPLQSVATIELALAEPSRGETASVRTLFVDLAADRDRKALLAAIQAVPLPEGATVTVEPSHAAPCESIRWRW